MLEKLLVSRELREEVAARGVEFAKRTFRADSYAEAFAAFAATVLRQAPVRTLEHTIVHHARLLGFGKDDPWTRRVNDVVENLFLPR